jgi:hypothetical protein
MGNGRFIHLMEIREFPQFYRFKCRLMYKRNNQKCMQFLLECLILNSNLKSNMFIKESLLSNNNSFNNLNLNNVTK